CFGLRRGSLDVFAGCHSNESINEEFTQTSILHFRETLKIDLRECCACNTAGPRIQSRVTVIPTLTRVFGRYWRSFVCSAIVRSRRSRES
ncbi:hypothetical protein V1477_019061, partial [Vespula maculifrons]